MEINELLAALQAISAELGNGQSPLLRPDVVEGTQGMRTAGLFVVPSQQPAEARS